MNLRVTRRLLPVVAAAVGAATFVAGCRVTASGWEDPGGQDGETANAGALPYEWLLAPVAEQAPPLAAPLALTVDPDRGRLFILEAVPPEVRVHELRSGRFVRRLGRLGAGPGEYRYPRAMATSAAGITAVLSMNGRVAFWGPDSSLLGTLPTATGLASDVVATAGDTFVVKTDVFPPVDVSEFRFVTPDGADSEPFYRDDGLPGIDQAGLPFRNHSYAVGVSGEGHLLLAPPGPAYRLLGVDAAGRVATRIERRDVAPLRRSEAEIEKLRGAVSRGFAASGQAPPARIPVPPYRPHVRRLERSPDGVVWALTGRGDESETVIDVFARDGAYVDTYRLELAATDLVVTGSAIYLLAESGDGIPGVAVAARPDIDRHATSE